MNGSVSVRDGGISVMMPAYNAERFLARAIESVLAQSFPNWELIIVDDGSTDRTAAIASGYRDARITIVQQKNRGEAAARNAAIDRLRGEYVGFLDADDVFLPHHLEAMVDYLKAHPEHLGVYGDGFYITEDERRLRTLSSRRRRAMTGRLFDELVRSSDVFGPPTCVVLRRDPVVRHGLRFAEEIVIGPDWDFFTRVADIGTFGYVDSITCLYRLHRTNISVTTGLKERAAHAAKCRMNAIRHPKFCTCPVEVRVAVFYDLLVHLLRNQPNRQQQVVEWPQFLALPAPDRARLFRLMASKSILFGGESRFIREWLRRARIANTGDRQAVLLDRVYGASPRLCRALLRVRTGNEPDPLEIPPFADMAVDADGGQASAMQRFLRRVTPRAARSTRPSSPSIG